MSTPAQCDVFTEVINDLMQELHALPYSTDIIYRLLRKNLSSPILAHIHHLSFSKLTSRSIDVILQALAKMPHLNSLSLSRCGLHPTQFKELFTQCPSLSNLQSLDLSWVAELASDDLLLLSQSTTSTSLTSLNFERCKLTASRTAAAAMPKPPKVDLDDPYAWKTPDAVVVPPKDSGGLIALLSSPVVKNLEHLNLSHTDIGDNSVAIALATSPYLTNLASLDLTYASFKTAGFTALAATTTLSNITHLNLSWLGSLGHDAIAELFSSASLLPTKLQSLNLDNHNISLPSLEVILEASPYLTELSLKGSRLRAEGIRSIAAHSSNLTKLNLSDCGLEEEGYAVLAESKKTKEI
jgi:hypothetical protein